MDIIQAMDSLIAEKSILKHPFYQKWASGKLDRKILQEYAKQYYFHVAAFAQYLSAIHSKMDNYSDRMLIMENLMDEECGDKNHPELWLRFADALEVERKDVQNAVPTAETNSFINNFRFVTSQKSAVEGIAALYAYESQIPRVSKEKIDGLKKFYGVSSETGLEYFTTHMRADIEHSAAERKLIKKLAPDEATQKKVLAAVSQTLDAYWLMLSGIEKMAGASCPN